MTASVLFAFSFGIPAVLGIILSAATMRRNGRNSVLVLIGSILLLLAAVLSGTSALGLLGLLTLVGFVFAFAGIVVLFVGALLPSRPPVPMSPPPFGTTPFGRPPAGYGPGTPFPGPSGPYGPAGGGFR